MPSPRLRRAPRRWPLAALLAILVAAGATTASFSQDEVTTVPLAIRAVGDIIVDAPHDRVVIAQGAGFDGLVATALDGTFFAAVEDQPGASDLLLSPDGSSLYVALSSGDAISALDPATLVERRRYDLGPGACPYSLAWAGQRLWISLVCGDAALGVLDPATGAFARVTPGLPMNTGEWKLAAASGTPSTLVALKQDRLSVFDVHDASATLLRSTVIDGQFPYSVALSPDGGTVYVADRNVQALRTDDLSVQATYGSVRDGMSRVTVAPDGGLVAVNGALGAGGVKVLRGDSLTELRDFPSQTVGLAFGPGSRLYSVDFSKATAVLAILTGAAKLATNLTAGVADTTVVGDQPAEIRGTLMRRTDGSPLAGRSIQASRAQNYGFLGYLSVDDLSKKALLTSPRTSLPPVITEADGSYVIRDVPPEEGEFTYTITWAGDEETVGATATVDAVKHEAYVDRVNLGPFPGLAYSVAISRERYPQDHAASVAVVATDRTFADALAGSALTGDGPLLLTKPSVPQLIRDELNRVLTTSQPATVYVLGGPLAIPDSDLAAFQGPGRAVRRLWGDTRVETSTAIAEEVLRQHPGTTIALARAWGTPTNPTAAWADSVSGGGWSAEAKVPILLTPTDQLHPAVKQFLQRRGVQTSVVLGGPAAISDAVAAQVPHPSRVAGEDRAGTAAQVADRLWPAGTDRFTVVNGYVNNGWIWGLAGAGLAAQRDAPILYTTRDTLPEPTSASAARARCDTTSPFTLLGGKDVVSPTAQQQLDDVARSHC